MHKHLMVHLPDTALTANGTVNWYRSFTSAGSSITYATYIASIDYNSAVIEWIPGEPVTKSMTIHCSLISKEHQTQKSGCWEWTKTTSSSSVINLGQYWFYYGESEVKLDIDKVTTDLKYNGGKLPDKAILEQVGNTVKYAQMLNQRLNTLTRSLFAL